MDINTTFWFFDRIREDNLCLLYNGNFSDEITTKLIELSEYNINNIDSLSKMKKKASFLIAECFQNIVRHGENLDEKKSKHVNEGFFLTKNWQGMYYITSGNLIEKKNITELEQQLEKVNSLNKEELKVLFREVLENHKLSDKGGAGLGLIEMARKSGHKLEYLFEGFDDVFSFFYNQIVLKSEQYDIPPDEVPFKLDEAINYHQKMALERVIVIHKGDFAQNSILPILKIIEENLQKGSKGSIVKKNVFHILVELLQNISRHCLVEKDKKEGIFMIGKSDDFFVVNTGNLIKNEDVRKLQKQIDCINGLNRKELKNLYLSRLRDRNSLEKGKPEIGLIDIGRKIISPINYTIHKIDDNKSFFSVNVIT